MHHSFLDRYSDLDSPIHRLDPRTKIITTLILVIGVVATPPTAWLAFALYFAALGGLVLLSRLPLLYVLKRSLVIVPFVLVVAISIPFLKEGETAGSYNIWLWRASVSHAGVIAFWNVAVKAWLSILATILLSSTTRMPDLLKGFQQLGLPRVMVMIISFMYRYFFVLADEAMRLWQARESRNFGGKRMWRLKTAGNLIGTLFIRSYEQSERTYAAMLSRLFDGQVRTLAALRFQRADLYYGVAFSLYVTAILSLALLWGFRWT